MHTLDNQRRESDGFGGEDPAQMTDPPSFYDLRPDEVGNGALNQLPVPSFGIPYNGTRHDSPFGGS